MRTYKRETNYVAAIALAICLLWIKFCVDVFQWVFG
jgi:hypothetical protein